MRSCALSGIVTRLQLFDLIDRQLAPSPGAKAIIFPRAATIRYFIVDAATGQVTRHAQSLQAYTDEEYQVLMTDCGFGAVKYYAALGREAEELRGELIAIVARQPHTV